MFQGMLNFKKKFNKEKEEHDKNVICFGCHKERHTIHSCFFLFTHLKGTDVTSRQDRRDKSSKDGFKGRRKAKDLNAIWNVDLDDDNKDSDNKASHSQEANFALMAMVEDISCGMDMETIIMELLRKIAELKKAKTQSSTMMCT
jgi:hypothetical protein